MAEWLSSLLVLFVYTEYAKLRLTMATEQAQPKAILILSERESNELKRAGIKRKDREIQEQQLPACDQRYNIHYI